MPNTLITTVTAPQDSNLYGSFAGQHLSDFTAMQALRPLSISAALDLVLAHPQWQGHLDATQIGGFGASMGGETMMLLVARLIFGDKAMFDMTAREYYITGLGATRTDGSERIFRGDASFTVSVYKRHVLGIQYVMSRRDSSINESHQRGGTWSLAYNFLGDSRFGAVEWRPAETQLPR